MSWFYANQGATITPTEGIMIPNGTLLGSVIAEGQVSACDLTMGGNTVTIDWGDGSSVDTLAESNLVLNYEGEPFNSTDIQFVTALPFSGITHTYTNPGTYAVNITINFTVDLEGPVTFIAIISSVAIVSDATLTSGYSFRTWSDVNQVFDRFFGSFSSADQGENASNFKALIDWGDGEPMSLGYIVPHTYESNPIFLVGGRHIYARVGGFHIKAIITDVDGAQTIVESWHDVHAHQEDLGPIELKTNDMLGKYKHHFHYLASFIDLGNSNADDHHFVATIDWGDKKPASRAFVQKIGRNVSQYLVRGDHKYHKPGSYNVTLNVNGMLATSIVTINK